MVFSKVLPFQAKKSKNDPYLFQQVLKMSALRCNGIVIEYNSTGFLAYRENDVFEARGHLTEVIPENVLKLGDSISSDFFNCHIGKPDCYFSSSSGVLMPLHISKFYKFRKSIQGLASHLIVDNIIKTKIVFDYSK